MPDIKKLEILTKLRQSYRISFTIEFFILKKILRMYYTLNNFNNIFVSFNINNCRTLKIYML